MLARILHLVPTRTWNGSERSLVLGHGLVENAQKLLGICRAGDNACVDPLHRGIRIELRELEDELKSVMANPEVVGVFALNGVWFRRHISFRRCQSFSSQLRSLH